MRIRAALALAGALFSATGFGQPNSAPKFDAASVKPHHRRCEACRPGNRVVGGPGTDDPGRIRYVDITLQRLLMTAYQVTQSQIDGAASMDSETYDVDMVLPRGTSREQLSRILQNLLALRFGLAAHTETRTIPQYVLTIGKDGPKLKTGAYVQPPRPEMDGFRVKIPKGYVVQPGGTMFMNDGDHARLSGNDVSMAKLTDTLQATLERPVVNRTGLTGAYDFTVYTSGTDLGEQEQQEFSVFMRLMEQLGLKLELRKMPGEVLVIDHLEKTPAPATRGAGRAAPPA